ncbi:MAG TPA: hypothetical protein VML55_26485 [Planctomycetaceae bacterium]|nr:hypothetical protein [Planctomycetaceae bacterium]
MPLTDDAVREFRTHWLPSMTDAALGRLITMLERNDPRLVRNTWTGGSVMGCLATQAAWNDARADEFGVRAGPRWLYRVAGIAPMHSNVVRDWDQSIEHPFDAWQVRGQLLAMLREEHESRRVSSCPADGSESCSTASPMPIAIS